MSERPAIKKGDRVRLHGEPGVVVACNAEGALVLLDKDAARIGCHPKHHANSRRNFATPVKHGAFEVAP